jgi:chorismate synthase
MIYNDKQWSIYKGKKLTVEVFGASHAQEIGVKVEGLNECEFDAEKLQKFLDRRKARNTAYSTKRLEGDKVVFESGFDGKKITNEQFKAVIKNNSQRSSDYEKTIKIPRPSHADYVAWSKYGDGFDYRGGGKFSGRMTAPMCIVGGICKQLLEQKGIKINAFISSIGNANGKTYQDIDVENFDFENL